MYGPQGIHWQKIAGKCKVVCRKNVNTNQVLNLGVTTRYLAATLSPSVNAGILKIKLDSTVFFQK